MKSQTGEGLAPDTEQRNSHVKPIAGAAIGNALEWVDYSLYGYMSAVFAKVFFPHHDPLISLIESLAAFAVAFATRPLGALFFGSLGDRMGRRDTLAIVVCLISASTFLVGALPSYASIGVAAPMLLILLRLLQGFSAGGEAGGALTFLAEYAPTRRRGLIISFFHISAGLGGMFASYLVLLITWAFGQSILESWAWRIPFLIAGPIGLGALWLRVRMEETPAFKEHLETEGAVKAPLREAIRSNWIGIVKCFGIAITHGVPYYLLLAYVPSYLISAGRMPAVQVLLASGLAFLASILVIPFAGMLSDRVGRRPVSLAAAFGYLVCALPIFHNLSSAAPSVVVATMVGLGILVGIYGSGPFCLMVELFPTRTRYSSMSIAYNLAMALFGGTAPLISASLVKMTGNPASPAYYVMGVAVLSIVAIWAAPETARVPVQDLGLTREHMRKARVPLEIVG